MENKLSKNLKYLRVKMGKSQTDIGLQVNKAHTSIGNWEKGIAEPSLKEIEQIARFFEISPADLLYADFENEGTGITIQHEVGHSPPADDYKEKYIALLERINIEQAQMIANLQHGFNHIKSQKGGTQANSNVA